LYKFEADCILNQFLFSNLIQKDPMKIKIYKVLHLILPVLFIWLSLQDIYGQEQDSLKKVRKNTVKFNITNPMFFGSNNYILGYERTIGKHQSFSLHVGTFSLGRIINFNTDSIKGLSKDVKSVGVSLSGDYRFYLAKENKYNSPHGLYIGPYFAINSFKRNYELTATTEAFTGQLNADFRFTVSTLGFQLGYQFVFWDRVSLDMILFGPGVSLYTLKAKLSTSLDPDQEAELFQKINDKLSEKIPGYSLVIKPGEFEKSGSVKTTSAGYRYIVMVGFRF
jgi:hypothetical protein